MYRIAVIQNESEMQRTGYANVIARLRTITCFQNKYSFDLYTVVNVKDLFESGYNNLCQYDSLIITTNATSDKVVHDLLVEKKAKIEEFINQGKGIFIASQKKLSKNEEEKTKGRRTDFLPNNYDFYTTPRPEDSSGEGSISIAANNTHNILLYPEKIDAKNINERCANNEFMKHFYRSHIKPVNETAYTAILIDDGAQYEEDDKFERKLVMVSAFPQHNERIVISTMAIDWAFHKNLLTNIVSFITEGLPQIAFVDKNKDENITCLIESANILKKSHKKYASINDIQTIGKKIHNIYIFSTEYTENEIIGFLENIQTQENNNFIKKRIYQVKENHDILQLFRYSNYASIDRIVAKSVAWLEAQYPVKGGMWRGGFWTTFEILSLFIELGIDVSKYISPILEDIKEKKHYNSKSHSYDGVVSATCGLIQLLSLLKNKKIEQNVFKDDDLQGMQDWIESKFDEQTPFDKRNVVITLQNPSVTQIEKALTHRVGKTDPSEIEICQIISVLMLQNNTDDTECKGRLEELINKQTSSGAWNVSHNGHDNIGRTAHVLIFLLQKFDTLKNYIDEDNFNKVIYRGILFLREKFNGKNWGDEDIQATAKAAQAIFLYNKKNHASMYDYEVLKIIEEENNEITSFAIIKDLTDQLKKYRTVCGELEGSKNDSEKVNDELKLQNIELEKVIEKVRSRNVIINYTLIIVIAILAMMTFKTYINENIYYSIIAGFITAVILSIANYAANRFNKTKSNI